MTYPERFENTTSVLIRAFLRGHLVHGDACACGVGNMIAAEQGYEIIDLGLGTYEWYRADGKERYPTWCLAPGEVNAKDSDINAMPYTPKELGRIERSFEDVLVTDGWDYSPDSDPDGFRGLCAAIDTLMEIDDVETCCAEDVIALEGEYAEVAV